VIWPSVWPLLHGRHNAAWMAAQIAAQPGGEATQLGHAALLGLLDPGCQRRLVPCPDQGAKALCECVRAVGLRAVLAERLDIGPL
jgi:hypothetical protein